MNVNTVAGLERPRLIRLWAPVFVLLSGLVWWVPGMPVFAQDPAVAEPGAATEACPDVRTLSASSESHPDRVQIDEWLIVEVSDVRALQCLGPVKLYLENNLVPIDERKIVAENNEVHFRLTHTQTPAAVEFWNELFQPLRFTREIEVGVGPEAGPIEAQGEVVIDLVVVPTVRFIIWAVLFLAGFLTLIWLGRNTNMLRDGPSSSSDGGRTRYSLGRVQMAFWFAMVTGAFSFIWLVTEEVDTLTASVVVLIGISAGTALSSVAVDAGKENTATTELAISVEQQKTLEATVATADAPTNSASTTSGDATVTQVAQQVRLEMLTAKIKSLEKTATLRPTSSFWSDILSDGAGISLSRVQIVVWTLILGVVFGHQVYQHLSMPEFSDQLLALMGVSSGTYVGFKFPEKK